MKGTDILDRMNTVDLKYVREMDGSERRTARINRLRNLSVAAAACLVIAAAVPVVWWGVSHRSEPVSPIVTDAPETKPSEETKPNTAGTESVFEIENGLLVAYRGSGEAVDLPDEVTAIGADAFAQCDTGEVKTVRLGANVSEIDSAAFVSLTALENVEVAEENEYYEICDGVLAARDGSVLFDVEPYIGQAEQSKRTERLFDVLKKLEMEDTEPECSRFIFGRMTAEIRFEAADPTRNDLKRVAYITSVTAYGQSAEFDSPIYLNFGDEHLRLFSAGNIYVFMSDHEYTYLFYPNNVKKVTTHIVDFEVKESTGRTICDNYITFYTGESGELRYKKSPEKYDTEGFLYDQVAALPLQFCVSLDEFAMEDGAADIVGDDLVLTPERVYTAGELFDLQALFEGFNTGFDTLEEYINYNSTRCPRARSLTPAE